VTLFGAAPDRHQPEIPRTANWQSVCWRIRGDRPALYCTVRKFSRKEETLWHRHSGLEESRGEDVCSPTGHHIHVRPHYDNSNGLPQHNRP